MALLARMVFKMGAHLYVPPRSCDASSTAPSTKSQTSSDLRNLFWLAYMIDKDLSIRTGRPPTINDDYCDLTMPAEYVEMTKKPVRDPGMHMFPGDIRLSMIKSRAYNGLYSVRGLQKSDAELLRTIRELDEELEMWRTSLPLWYRPTLSFSYETTTSKEAVVDMHSLIIRLDYHHCMAIVHQASSRCKAWNAVESEMMNGVGSSLDLSVDASRSSLMYLHAAHHNIYADALW